jgi:hypothetical protein
MQDVRRCMGEHLLKISEAHGAVVPKLGSRNGRRAEAARASVGLSANWGGAREKGAAPEEAWCHPAVVDVRAANIAASIARS